MEYDFLPKLYNFAKENGFKVEDLNVGDRSSKKGNYKYVTLALIVPGKDYKPFSKQEINDKKGEDSNPQTKENEVNNNEI